MSYRYITTNNDVDAVILASLPFNDMRNFCYANQQTNHFCHTQPQLRQKIETVSEMVNNLFEDYYTNAYLHKSTQFEVFFSQPMTLETFNNLLKEYRILTLGYHTLDYHQLLSLTFFEPIEKQLMIKIKIRDTTARNGYRTINTDTFTQKQAKSLLFHLFYDNLISY